MDAHRSRRFGLVLLGRADDGVSPDPLTKYMVLRDDGDETSYNFV